MNLTKIDLTSVHVSKNNSEHNYEYTFDYDSLNIYLSINENDNLFDLYKNSGKPLNVFETAINKLFEQELIHQVFKIPILKPETLEKIEKNLAVQVGPLAPVIIADAIKITGIVNNSIPVSKTTFFINEIIKQIPQDRAKIFKKSLKFKINSEG